jgi:hypothetical protein
MYLPHFFVLLLILFASMAACIVADYFDVDRRQARRERDLAEVTPFPKPGELKRAA